jgi:hypothetical protein
MSYSTLRTFTNKPGVAYDVLKTKVIFAEDLNLVGSNLEDHEERIVDLEAGGGGVGDVNWGGNTNGAKKTIGSIDNQDIGILSNNTERITVLKGGNVGVGTASPGSKLTVGNTNGFSSKLLTVSDRTSPSTNAGANGILVDINGGGGIYMTGDAGTVQGKYEAFGGALGIGTMSAHPITLHTSNGERMRILSTGNVGIGTTAPTAKLHLAAGTATANTAPLKFTAGVVNTVSVAGCVEFDGTDFFLNV